VDGGVERSVPGRCLDRCEAAEYVNTTDRVAPGVNDDETDDPALVRRALGGDVDAYGDLVRRHQGVALRVAAGICGSTEEARDIVQDAFVKGHRALGSWRGDAPVRSWLLRIVANDARNAVRATGRRRRREDRVVALGDRPAVDPVGDAVAADDEARVLLALLGRLDERDRAVLSCRFVAGLSERETAVALEVPVGTVKSRAARALERARDLLAEVGP